MIEVRMVFDNMADLCKALQLIPAGSVNGIAVTMTESPLAPTEPTGVEKPKRTRKAKEEPAAEAPATTAPPLVVGEEQRDELRTLLKTFMTKNGLAASEALLAKYGAKKVMDLKAESFEDFKKDLIG